MSRGITWSLVTLCCRAIQAPPRKWQHYSSVTAVSVGSIMVAVSARREVVCSYVVLCYFSCYSCCASQKRIHVSAVPMAPQVFFQPLSSCLAYPGLSQQCRQCKQQDNWHHKQMIDNTVTLHGMAHSCIELCKPFHHDKAVIHEEGLYHNACKCRITV